MFSVLQNEDCDTHIDTLLGVEALKTFAHLTPSEICVL